MVETPPESPLLCRIRDCVIGDDQVMWGPYGPDNAYRFSAMCSDTFQWASADSEIIEPEDLQLLGECLADLRARGGHDYLMCELFAARKRGMRPMPRWIKHYAHNPEIRRLFEAAGPPRESEFGAP